MTKKVAGGDTITGQKEEEIAPELVSGLGREPRLPKIPFLLSAFCFLLSALTVYFNERVT